VPAAAAVRWLRATHADTRTRQCAEIIVQYATCYTCLCVCVYSRVQRYYYNIITVCVVCRATVSDRTTIRLERDCCGRSRLRRCSAAPGAAAAAATAVAVLLAAALALAEFPPPRRPRTIGWQRPQRRRPPALDPVPLGRRPGAPPPTVTAGMIRRR